MAAVPPAVFREIERRLGPHRGWWPSPGATQGQVWRVDTAAGRFAVKVGPPGPLRREHDALRQLADQDLVVPTVRMFVADLESALVTDWIEGEPADGTDPRVHLEAGRYLARLHRIRGPDDPMPWTEALAHRRDAWLRRARERLESKWVAGFEAAFDDPAIHRIARVLGPRAWCHRDYEPRNWRIEAHCGSFRAIDFGQARPDAWLMDLVKLAESLWREHPATRSAFFEGYGRDLNPDEARSLHELGLLHGLQTYVWALERGDEPLLALGRAILARRLG